MFSLIVPAADRHGHNAWGLEIVALLTIASIAALLFSIHSRHRRRPPSHADRMTADCSAAISALTAIGAFIAWIAVLGFTGVNHAEVANVELMVVKQFLIGITAFFAVAMATDKWLSRREGKQPRPLPARTIATGLFWAAFVVYVVSLAYRP